MKWDPFGLGKPSEDIKEAAGASAQHVQHGMVEAGAHAEKGMREHGQEAAKEGKEAAIKVSENLKGSAEGARDAGDATKQLVEATKEPAAALINSASSAVAAGAAIYTADKAIDWFLKLTDGRARTRADIELTQAHTQAIRVNTANGTRQELNADKAQQSQSVYNTALSLLRAEVMRGADHQHCADRGTELFALFFGIINSSDGVDCLDQLRTTAGIPAFATIVHKVYPVTRGQANMDEIEDEVTKWVRAKKPEDKLQVYVLFETAVDLGKPCITRLDISRVGRYTSEYAQFHGACEQGLVSHILPASIQLYSQLGDQWTSDIPLLVVISSVAGQAFLQKRFHNIRFFATDTDVAKARTWAAAAKRFGWRTGLPWLWVIGAGCMCPAVALGYGVTLGPPAVYYAGVRALAWASPPIYLYGNDGEHRAVRSQTELGEAMKKHYGWRVVFCM